MTSIPTNVRNYFKLELLIAHACVRIRQLFKDRYAMFNNGSIWDDSSVCGNNYSVNVIAKNKNLSLTKVEKASIVNGDSNHWDLTTLTALLLNTDRPNTLDNIQIQQLDSEDTVLKKLRDIRNELIHSASKSIKDIEFNKFWSDLSAILVAFGDVKSELDKLKGDNVFNESSRPINEENVKEALRLNSLAIQAHKNAKYSDAIELFTKAIALLDILDQDRAVFYSNMSSSRLALYEQKSKISSKSATNNSADERYQALQDAKQARNLRSTWWKGYFRVGKVYAILDDHEEAIISFERGLALDPANMKIQKAIDESRHILGRQSRQEHLDPRTQPITIPEHLNEMQQKFGTDPQYVRQGHSFSEQFDSAMADVVRGHKYEHGDIGFEQDYEQAAKYFEKAANQGNAEGMYNLARLTDRGLGIKKDHDAARKLLEQAAAQSPQHPLLNSFPNLGVAESEHALGLRYTEGVGVQKNLPTAAYWYQRATDHGSAESANNLGLMYLNGTGVDRNLDKAEELLQLSSRRGDPNAMLTLAEHLLGKGNVEMAKIWYDRACEAGNIVAQTHRGMYERIFAGLKQSVDQAPPEYLKAVERMKNVLNSLKPKGSIYTQSSQSYPYLYKYNILKEYAHRGSIIAKILCNAIEHFAEVLIIVTQSESLTEEQENLLVHELSRCYRLEHIVAQFPSMKVHKKIVDIVDRTIHRCGLKPDKKSKLDEDARICYVILHMDSHELVSRFLEPCKENYPRSVFLFELSAVYGWLEKYENVLYEANAGLQIDPNYYELMYAKAVALRLSDTDMNEAIEAYRTFIVAAPKDHRKVPESYYSMAVCYLQQNPLQGLSKFVKETYEKGEQAEKIQLPCFLPYSSNNKILLKSVLDVKNLLNTEISSTIDSKAHLKDSHRIEIITLHRQWQSKVLEDLNSPIYIPITGSYIPQVRQPKVKSLIGLKPISIREMNPRINRVYEGYILSVTIIEEADSWSPSIHLVVEDGHLDCERIFIYNFPEDQGKYLTKKVYTLGSKMQIINPYLRIGLSDRKALIRIDDSSSIIMQDESERVINMCRCCGQANALHVCSRCNQARYCNKECETMDWNVYQHKLICRKR
ncbi:hypothetical protein I4U23_022737 [Adineta vaga]|nr:hypothetical protein I4U23_022737 [Adineta vaga]